MDLPIQISPSHFEKVNQLGSGTIGKVYLAKEKSTQQEFAIKFIKTEIMNNNEIIQYINEISQVYHPIILRPFGYSLPDHSKKRPMSLVTNFQNNGSLSFLLQNPNELTDFRKLKILFGIAEGLRYLHENHFVHGDLTPGNILLNENIEPILTDYSLSKIKPRKTRIPPMNICFYAPENDITELTASARDENSESSSESPTMAIKQFSIIDNFQDIEPSADVFSYGMIVYTMITGSYPYTEEESKDVAIRIKQGERPPLLNSIPENWQMLISQCWNSDPSRRPTFESIVLRFLKNEFSFPMKSIESIQLHNYQSKCLSPSFATKTLISTLDQIQILTDNNRNLTRMVETLRRNVDFLSHNVAQMQRSVPNDRQLASPPNGTLNKPNFNRRMSVKPSSKAFIDTSLFTPGSKDTNSTTFEFPRFNRTNNEDNNPSQAKKNTSSVVFKDVKPMVTFSPIQKNLNENKDAEAFPRIQPSSLQPETEEKPNSNEEDLSPFPTFGSSSKKLQRINPTATLSGSSLPPVASNLTTPFPSINTQSNTTAFPSIKNQSDTTPFPSINNQANCENTSQSIGNNDKNNEKEDADEKINNEPVPNSPIPPQQIDPLPVPVPPQRQNSFVAQPAQMQQIPTNRPRLSLQPANGTIQRTRSKSTIGKRKSGFGFEEKNNNSTAPASPLARKSSKISSQLSLDALNEADPNSTPTKQVGFGGFSSSSNDSPVMPLSQSSKKLKKTTSQREVSNTPLQFPYAYSPFDGIFAHLTQEVNGNLVERGVLNIIGNSADKNRESTIHEVVNFDWDRCWTSANVPNSFIQFDFGMHQVYITHYTIKTYPCGKGYSHLKNWALEGFADGQWYEIDRRDDNNELNGKSKTATFQVAANGEFTSIRLRQTGPNHYGDNYLILTNIELFGDFV